MFIDYNGPVNKMQPQWNLASHLLGYDTSPLSPPDASRHLKQTPDDVNCTEYIYASNLEHLILGIAFSMLLKSLKFTENFLCPNSVPSRADQ